MTDQASAQMPSWRLVKIGELFESWGGHTPSKANPSYWGPGLPWISSKEVKSARLSTSTYTVTQKAIEETGLRVCPVGSVLVVVRSGILAHTLPVAVTEAPVTINQDLKAFYSDEPFLNEWLALFLRMSAHELLASSRRDGTTVQSVQYPLLKNTLIPVPRIEDRRRTIEIIEKALAKQSAVPHHLASARRAIERFRRVATLAAASGRLTASWRMERGLLDLEQSPTTWQSGTLNDLAECLDSRRKPINATERAQRTGDVPYYGANGQVGWIDKALFDETLVLVVEDETFTGRVKPFSYLITGPSWVNNHAHVLRARKSILPEMLNIILSYYDFIPMTSGTTGRRKLTKASLMSSMVDLPPADEQAEIVRRLDQLLTFTETLLARIDAADLQVARSSQAALAKAFRGELLPLDADLSPISKEA